MTVDSAHYPDVNYSIDAEDCLVLVDDAWENFAQQNKAPAVLLADSVIGKSLWSFVREETLQAIYRELIEGVRSERRAIRFDFRCDSPDFRRYMHMTMTPGEGQIVHFHSRTKAVKPRTEGIRAMSAFGGAKHIMRCSICNLYRLPDGEWAEVATAIDRSELLDTNLKPKLVWSVCSPCKHHVLTNA